MLDVILPSTLSVIIEYEKSSNLLYHSVLRCWLVGQVGGWKCLTNYRTGLQHQLAEAKQDLIRAEEVRDREFKRTCRDRVLWVLRKFYMLNEHGLMLRDLPACRKHVWRSYGLEEGDAIVHRLSEEEIAWNNTFCSEIRLSLIHI